MYKEKTNHRDLVPLVTKLESPVSGSPRQHSTMSGPGLNLEQSKLQLCITSPTVSFRIHSIQRD